MALSGLRAKSEEQRQKILEEKMKRAQQAAQSVLSSDTFKVQVASLPDTPGVIESVVQETVKAVLDPVNDYIDTLTAKGFTEPAIRKATKNLAIAFDLCAEDVLFEDKVKVVAAWVAENPWVYDSLSNYT